MADRRGRPPDRAILSMLAAGVVSLVVGFALLRILVTYSMNEPALQTGHDAAADPRLTATAAPIETLELAVTASPEVTAVVTPEPAAVVTPESAAAATPEPAAAASCGQATVNGVSSLNIRAEPNITSPVVGNRAAGSVVELLCDAPVVVNGIPWRRVRSENVEGWMSERYLQVSPAQAG
ncbi:MAG TPA: SH3 domain-containing protein [Herpetosiphonaceae bacterium]|nr:SH3 domain-containing protein [Herpetosiphonaceae bacterium]